MKYSYKLIVLILLPLQLSCTSKLLNFSLTENKHNYFSYYTNLKKSEILYLVEYSSFFNSRQPSIFNHGGGLKFIDINLPFRYEQNKKDTLTSYIWIYKSNRFQNTNLASDSLKLDFTKYKYLEKIDLYCNNIDYISSVTKKVLIKEPLYNLKLINSGTVLIPSIWYFDVENISIVANTIQFESNVVFPRSLKSLEFYLSELKSEIKFDSPSRLYHLHFQMPSSDFENAVKNKKINFENLVADSLYLPFEINEIPNLVNTSYKTIRTYYINTKILDLDKLPAGLETFHTFYINRILGSTSRLQKLKNLSFAFEGDLNPQIVDQINQLNLESVGIFTNKYNSSLDDFLKKSTIPSIIIFGLIEDDNVNNLFYKRKGIEYHNRDIFSTK